MQLFTPLTLPSFSENFLLTHHSRSVSIGSCFAEHLAQKLCYYGFHSFSNPIGTVFHPLAIASFLERVQKQLFFNSDDVFEANGVFLSFETHSQCRATEKEKLVNLLNSILLHTKEEISLASHIFITLGTSWVYRYNHTGKIVASCHKVPQKFFKKELLSFNSLTKSYNQIFESVLAINPHIKLIFTISPVRHLKDGFIENQRSKALLISSLHDFLERHTEQVSYFPSYEIMLDELRDYRFFDKDLVHPSALAIDYIFEQFTKSLIHPKAWSLMQDVQELRKGLSHKPFNPNTLAHKSFEEKIKLKTNLLKQQLPFLTV